MNMSAAMMVTVTLIMTAAMVPRIYLAWMTAEQYRVEGEIESLKHLLAEQNRWIGRQFFCGATALAMLLMVKTSQHDLEIPVSMAAALAAYAVISMIFAVLESLVAQKAFSALRQVPVGMKAGRSGGNLR